MSEHVELDRAGEAALFGALRRFWHPVCFADDLGTEPLAVTLLEEPVVVARLGDEVVALRDLCIHRGTPLSLGTVTDEHLVCAYHGWTYDSNGRCTRIPARHGTNIPAKARVARYLAAENAGLIWVCLDEDPALPVPTFAEIDDPTYRTVRIPTYDWASSAARRVENFVDFSHFPFVHAGILGDPDKPEIPDHEVVRDEATLRFSLGIEEPANPLKADDGGAETIQREPSDYVISMPFSVSLNQPLPEGKHFVLFVASSPVTRGSCRSFSFCARNYDLDPARDDDYVAFQETILEQDRVVVEAQRPEELPVDLSAELHVRGVDRVSLDYRRWLGEIAATATT
jgi:phenylpropionate dioxygenase-like ring-hydroxylating dioxygenase large terminal subunit